MKRVMTPVNVLTNADGHPSGLNGPQRPVKVVHILDFWQDGGEWWKNEPARDYYLLELESGNVCEVFKEVTRPGDPDLSEDNWTLSRIAD